MVKRSAAIVIIALVVIVVLIVSLFYPTQKKPKEVTGLEIAKQSLSFLDKMREPDNMYSFYLKYASCKDNNNTICEKTKIKGNVPSLNTWATFVYLNLYRSTGDNSYLNKAKNEADLTMSLSGDAAPLVLIPIYEMYQETKDKKYLDFINENGPKILNASSKDFLTKTVEAKILTIMFSLTQDLKYLNEAKVRIFQAEATLKNVTHHHLGVAYSFNDQVVYRPQCLIQIAKMNYYLVRNEQNYLDEVVSFLDKAEVGGFPQLIQATTFINGCIEALMMAHQITGKDSYRVQAENMMNFLLSARYDSEERKLIDGDNGFLFVDNAFRVNQEDINRKYTADTAYTIFLLSTFFKDNKFVVGI